MPITERDIAIKRLRGYFEPQLKKGKIPEIHGVVTHVSKSGMTRDIHFTTAIDGRIVSIDYEMSKILGRPLRNNGVRVSGVGMDMIFEGVYQLGNALFGYGEKSRAKKFKIKASPARGQKYETDGGYLLKASY